MKYLLFIIFILCSTAYGQIKYMELSKQDSLIAEANEALSLAIALLDEPRIKTVLPYLDEVDNLKERIRIIESERMQRAILNNVSQKLKGYILNLRKNK